MSRAPAILDLARLLDEHATAGPAAASALLEEMNQLAHHRRLALAVSGVEPLADVDRPALEVEQGQDLGRLVTDLLEQNVPLEDVQYLAGHSDPRTTRIYDRRRHQRRKPDP